MTVTVGNNRYATLAAVLVGVVTMIFVTTGCERPDWEDPDYVAEMLAEGDSSERRLAVEQLREFPEERRAEIAPVLSDVYLEEERLRSDVMRRLIEWRLEGAKPAYLEELAEDHTGYGQSAARVLGEIGAEEAVPDMIEVFEATSDNSRRIGILSGLSQMPEPEAIEKAEEVFELDVDNYPIDLHRAACEFVGGLAVEHPDALTEDLKRKLVYARFLASEDGRTTSEACGLAIQTVGPAIVPYLIELFEGENEDVQRLLMTYDDPNAGEHFPQNNSKHTAAEHLSALRAADAVELFVDELESTVEGPDLDGERLHNWRATEVRTINEMVRGLGDIGDPAARPVLEATVQGETFSEWEEVIDGTTGFQMLQDTARSLARLGDREARPTLMEMTGADIIPGMAARFAAMERAAEEDDSVNPVPLIEQLRPQWLAAKAFTLLGEAGDREEFESLVEDIEDEELTEKLDSFVVAFDVMDDCEEVDDADEQAQCFGGFLEADEEHARQKAVYELSRMPPEAAGPVVAQALDTRDLDLRESLTFAAYRVPSPELADAIEEILDAESARSGSEYERDHRRLRMLRGWLHGQEVAAE